MEQQIMPEVVLKDEELKNFFKDLNISWVVCVCHFLVTMLILLFFIKSIEGYINIKDVGIKDVGNALYIFYILYHGFLCMLYILTFVYSVLNFASIDHMKYVCCIFILVLFFILMGIVNETCSDSKVFEITWCILLLILSYIYLYDYYVAIYNFF